VDRSDYASARWPKSALPLVLYSRLYWPTNSIYRHSEGGKQPVNGILERKHRRRLTKELRDIFPEELLDIIQRTRERCTRNWPIDLSTP
jgi:hypothetical protein